jgi:hypothetical protein
MTARNRAMIHQDVRKDVGRAVNAPPDDGVSSVCTAHSTTTQKPTMLGDWRK